VATRIYTTLYQHTDSFHDIGSHVAYLLGAFLTGTKLELFEPLEDDEQRFIDVMHTAFTDNDIVWKHIVINAETPTPPAMHLDEVCRNCNQPIGDDGRAWIDATGGDVCGVDGDNAPHEPALSAE
jgi:hypothetical protein